MQIIRTIVIAIGFSLLAHAKPFVVVIDPAGDAKHTGRQLDDAWERGITLQCAQAVQKRMELIDPSITIILTRMPGETIAELQNAQLANQLQADLFISLNFYHEHSLTSYWYTFLLDLGDSYILKPREYAFYYYDQAHMLCMDRTKQYADALYEWSQTQKVENYAFQAPQSIPVKLLMGVACPGLCFDIGLKTKESWKQVIEPLCTIIQLLHRLGV